MMKNIIITFLIFFISSETFSQRWKVSESIFVGQFSLPNKRVINKKYRIFARFDKWEIKEKIRIDGTNYGQNSIKTDTISLPNIGIKDTLVLCFKQKAKFNVNETLASFPASFKVIFLDKNKKFIYSITEFGSKLNVIEVKFPHNYGGQDWFMDDVFLDFSFRFSDSTAFWEIWDIQLFKKRYVEEFSPIPLGTVAQRPGSGTSGPHGPL